MTGRIDFVERGRRRSLGPADAALRATVHVHSRRFWPSLLRGSVGLADSYAAGHWDCDDLVTLVRILAREMPLLDRLRRPFVPLAALATRVPRNTRSASRRHISAHYDLGDRLFELFLDETMTYSCAVFAAPGMTLREAQEEKLDRICRKLELRPDDHLLEIGSGWGSLAVHAASRYGCRVTTTTISRNQHERVTDRARAAGLDDRVTVLLQDYRELRGSYDKVASVEMIEAVGWQYFADFFARCSGLLTPDGLMLLQAITIDDRAYLAEKAAKSFANTHVFPGGCLPSVEVLARSSARASDMRWLGLEDLTAHYPKTLRLWRERFLANAARAEELGYDERFRRIWDLYLAYSEGGFRERRIGTVQVLLAKPGYREGPLAGGRGSRENMRDDTASSRNAGPRDASLARAVLPPGPST